MSVNITPTQQGWDNAYTGMNNGIGSGYVFADPDGSVRVELAGSPIREANGKWTAIKPGDSIHMSAQISVSSSSNGDTQYNHGAVFGYDLYDNGGRITGIQTPNGVPSYTPSTGQWAPNNNDNIVPFNSTKVSKQINGVIPQYVEADGFGGLGNYPAGEIHTPTAIVPWLMIFATAGETAHANFYQTETTIPSSTVVLNVFVVDQANKPVAGASVTATSNYFSLDPVVTPASGNYTFGVVQNTAVTLVATYSGFRVSTVITADVSKDVVLQLPFTQTVTPIPSPIGSQMWVATALGYDTATIDKLRVLGHLILPQNIIDLYHNNGEDLAAYVVAHPEIRDWLRRQIDKIIKIASI